jgi:hypothetical protein
MIITTDTLTRLCRKIDERGIFELAPISSADLGDLLDHIAALEREKAIAEELVRFHIDIGDKVYMESLRVEAEARLRKREKEARP